MYKAKRGWKQITNKKILEIYNEVCDEARKYGLLKGENPPLYSHKSYRSLGACYWEKGEDGEYDVAITLSEYLLSQPDRMRDTIIHEVGHATAIGNNHGYKWQSNTNTIGRKWGYTASRINRDRVLNEMLRNNKPKKKENDYKYEVYCPGCGAKWKYKTKCMAVQEPDSYICNKCKIDLMSRAIGEVK